MVGRDKEGELMCDGGLSCGDCCCAAASSADVALWGSAFDLGEVEKKDVILFAREVDGRRGVSFFSERIGWAEGVVGVELAKGLRGLRGIANRKVSEFIEMLFFQCPVMIREGKGAWEGAGSQPTFFVD